MPVSLGSAHWIWYPEGDPTQNAPAATRYLRRDFTAPAGPYSDAQLVLTGDDAIDVWLNGTYLAGSPRTTDAWKQARYVDLAAALKTGANTLEVAVRNTTAGPAGLLAHLRVVAAGGTVDLVTDGAWQAANSVPKSWVGAKDLGAYGSGPWAGSVAAPDPGAASPVTVAGLTTEHQTDPIGIDAVKPRFGWRLVSSATDQVQGRYEVAVGSTANGNDVWDSGVVASGQSVDVPYGGPALASNRTYHWRVRVWDAQGRPGPWSAAATFDTGLFNPATEWQADFIGAPVTENLTGANWIWYPEGDPATTAPAASRYFRRTFNLDTTGRTVLVVTGDDTADAWVNGTQVSTSRRATDSWKRATTVDVTAYLHTGSNTIAIAATNTTDSPASVIAKLGAVVTDAGWKASTTAPAGWEQPGFNDTAWPAAKVTAALGAGPWGTQVTVPHPTPYVGKGFDIAKPVQRARLFATALGLHETYLNGRTVTDERLAPGWTDYTKRLQYRTYDVTGDLNQGSNTLGALVGNGWYSGNIGFAGSQRYGTQPWYSAQLSIEYTDGTTAVIKTDSSWTTKASTIVDDDLYQGEDQDARIQGTSSPVVVKTGPKPNLVAQVDPGVTVQQEFPPKSITQPKPGTWIADLGQNFAGWDRITATGTKGTKITLRHGEILNADGTLYTANLRAAQATDTFTLAGTGQPETFEPHFTVHGYRYVEITGARPDQITGEAAWTGGAPTGTFTTSDAMVNQLESNILWGARSNMLSIPTDCPQRDERLGWTGDIAAFSATSTFNFDTHGLLAKFVDDLVDAQDSNGAFPDVAPKVIDGEGKAGWADAGIIVPYNIWQRYGDLTVVDKHFDAMKRYVDYLKSTAGSDLVRNQDTFGDWLNVDDPTPNDVTSTAYFAWSARLLSRMAAATGRTADAQTYGTLADQVTSAFDSHFLSGLNSQTGYVLALAFGLVPADQVQATADKLAAKVDSRNDHLSVGFMGVENLLPVLADHGHADTAYKILQQPDYPGWGYMISRGATTIWERWDGIKTDGTLEDPGMNSFNHYGLGSVGDWLYRTVGGLAPATPGYRQMLIAPKPGGSLTAATASLTTAYGVSSSVWSRTGTSLTLKVSVPPNATAIVRMPASSAAAVTAPPEAVPQGFDGGAAVFAVGSGSYTFTAS
ncbi:MAG TPA: family 78 glycoside hydrolase catalytic domain [Actinoplanes sp.]